MVGSVVAGTSMAWYYECHLQGHSIHGIWWIRYAKRRWGAMLLARAWHGVVSFTYLVIVYTVYREWPSYISVTYQSHISHISVTYQLRYIVNESCQKHDESRRCVLFLCVYNMLTIMHIYVVYGYRAMLVCRVWHGSRDIRAQLCDYRAPTMDSHTRMSCLTVG